MEHQNIELSSEWPGMLGLDEEDPEIPIEAYFDASFSGYHGTSAQLIVLKDTDADGNYAPGVDTFKWAAAYQTPPNFVPAQNIPGPNPDDGAIEEDDILRSVTGFIGGRWKAAKVNEKAATISEPSLIHIQHRSYQRMWLRFRKLQLLMVAQEMPQGILPRVKPIIAEVHTEAAILRETTLMLGQRFPGTQFLARMGRFVPVAGTICSVLSAVETGREIVPVFRQYLLDVRRHCDNNNDTALDLAVMGSMLTDNAFPAPAQTAYLWPIWWNELSNFDGWSSSCF